MKQLTKLMMTKQTVFNIEELTSYLQIPTSAGLKSFLQRAKQSKALLNPIKGIWTFPVYDPFEFSCKLNRDAYISCETVLFREGIFFQFYGDTVSSVTFKSRSYDIDGQHFIYYRIQPKIAQNLIGIRDYDCYRMATPERALCDYIYLHPKASIDAPELINQRRIEKLYPFYPKKTVLRIKQLLNAQS